MQILTINFDVFQRFIQQQLLNGLTAQLGDFTLQATNARFTGVVTNNADNGAVVDGQFAFFQRVAFDLLRQQVTLGDVQFFIFGVTREANHFHTVQQRRRNVHGVGSRHEHHVAEIVIHFQIVVVKGHVLLRIQHLKQRRSRVAAHVGRHFVNLIQQEQRVFYPHFRHFLDQFARHRANIGSTMTANFRFIAHAAQRHADVFPAGRFGDRLPQRGFTYPRRSHQAEDRPLDFVHPALHREILKDAILHALQTIVIGIEDLLGLTQVFLDLTARIPRHLHHPVDVATHDGRFRRHRRHHLQLLQFRFGFLFRLFRHFRRVDLALQRFVFVRGVVHLAEFFLNRFHLLVQIVLALGFLHLLFDAVANALLNLQQIDFRFHHRHQIFQTFVDVGHLKHGLLVRQLQRHMRRDGIRQARRIVDAVQRRQHFRWNLLIQLDIAFKLADSGTNQHFLLTFVNRRRVEILRFRREMLAIIRQRRNACTL